MITNLLALAIYALTATKTMAADYVLGASDTVAERTFSLKDRYPVQSVSDVFQDNILLTLAYMDGKVPVRGKIDWSEIEKPQTYSFTLQPGQTFAFHNDVLPEYEGKVTLTMNAHFNGDDGFKSDGWLTGDGVCHLASFMYMVAKDAGLTAVAPTRHDFANIPEVPREYGVAIYQAPGKNSGNEAQNLYITDNLGKPVTFNFTYDGTSLNVKVID